MNWTETAVLIGVVIMIAIMVIDPDSRRAHPLYGYGGVIGLSLVLGFAITWIVRWLV
jgi:hypothetical protein